MHPNVSRLVEAKSTCFASCKAHIQMHRIPQMPNPNVSRLVEAHLSEHADAGIRLGKTKRKQGIYYGLRHDPPIFLQFP